MQTDLSAMMHKLLEYMDVDVKNTMDKIMAVLPQLVYSIVGILIIFVVIVVLVPCIKYTWEHSCFQQQEYKKTPNGDAPFGANFFFAFFKIIC